MYDPKARITAKQALKHPWFKETFIDDGTEALRIGQLRRDEWFPNARDFTIAIIASPDSYELNLQASERDISKSDVHEDV